MLRIILHDNKQQTYDLSTHGFVSKYMLIKAVGTSIDANTTPDSKASFQTVRVRGCVFNK